MAILQIKQGETFILEGQYVEDDGITPKSLTGVTLKCQVRTKKNLLIATMTVVIVDAVAGTYTISAPLDTTTWPIETLYMDIKEQIGGVTMITETVIIMIENAVTTL